MKTALLGGWVRIVLFLGGGMTSLVAQVGEPEASRTTEGTPALSSEDQAERLRRIADEVRRRRALRENRISAPAGSQEPRMMASSLLEKTATSKAARYDPMINGGVFQPRQSANPAGSISAKFADTPVAVAAEVYAQFLGKEVMVSSRVARVRLNLDFKSGTREQACEAFATALREAGVVIREVGPSAVALLAEK